MRPWQWPPLPTRSTLDFGFAPAAAFGSSSPSTAIDPSNARHHWEQQEHAHFCQLIQSTSVPASAVVSYLTYSPCSTLHLRARPTSGASRLIRRKDSLPETISSQGSLDVVSAPPSRKAAYTYTHIHTHTRKYPDMSNAAGASTAEFGQPLRKFKVSFRW